MTSTLDSDCSAEISAQRERRLRIDLAAAFRLAARYGWGDQLATHMSVRIPGPEPRFLINPYGLLFDEITASDLVMVDAAGDSSRPAVRPVNKAGFVIHSAIHAAREDAQCIIHLHTVAGSAVAAQADGLLPISPLAMYLAGRIGYHDFEGVTIVLDEQERIVSNLGAHVGLIFRNHGTLTVGRNVGEAFHRMYMMERACQIQIAAQSGGRLLQPSENIAGLVHGQLESFGDVASLTWDALLRSLERSDPDYRS